MKVRTVQGGGQIFFCPGCEEVHQVNTSGPRWTYNNNPDKPTFAPSILVTGYWAGNDTVCHSFVNDGQIQFLNDCTHKLAGQTVAMPEWPYAAEQFGGIEE